MDERDDRRKQRRWLNFWIATSFVADTGVIALFGAGGFVAAQAWLHYALAGTVVLGLFFGWSARIGADRNARRVFDRVIRVLAIGYQLAFAWFYPPLVFYCLGITLIILGFTHKRPRVRWAQSVLEWALVAVGSGAVILVLGPQAAPPLATPTGRAMVVVAVMVTLARATLFGYWSSELRAYLGEVKERWRSLSGRLEEQVAQRTRELELRNRELAQMNRHLQDIATSVAHDFRQPIISIGGHASRLRTNLADAAPAQANGQEHLDRIGEAAQHMDRLCEGLLRLIAVERAQLCVADVDVSALATRIAATLRAERPGHAVELVVPPGMRAQADPQLLRQVLEELMRNAWQFTKAGARIELRAQLLGEQCEFSVCDNGVGFDDSFAHHLFGPFQRLHAEGGKADGLGLGLAIAQRIVARHGGTIRGRTRPEGGACFTFSLPV